MGPRHHDVHDDEQHEEQGEPAMEPAPRGQHRAEILEGSTDDVVAGLLGKIKELGVL